MRYSVETKQAPETVVEEARFYFINSFGLKISSEEENKLCMEGSGGYVTILLYPGPKMSVEIVDTRVGQSRKKSSWKESIAEPDNLPTTQDDRDAW